MANHGTVLYTGPENIEALTADREKMWSTFTSATSGAVVFLVLLLIAMAFFLL